MTTIVIASLLWEYASISDSERPPFKADISTGAWAAGDKFIIRPSDFKVGSSFVVNRYGAIVLTAKRMSKFSDVIVWGALSTPALLMMTYSFV